LARPGHRQKKEVLRMSENWLQEYIFLAFRLHRSAQTTYGSPFVEEYWGPPAWRKLVEAEPETMPADLVRQAMALTDALPVQGFVTNRAAYLGKHLRAMETLARKLCGETFTLAEEAALCLDIHPMWTPEAQFEQAHALYETVLPGIGSLAERLRAYKTGIACPPEQINLLPGLVDLAFAEARERTSSLVELPDGETIDIQYLPEWEHEAAAYYRGNYRTQIVINTAAAATSLSRLFDHKVCHEGYPGHHTDYVLKEQRLARQGYTEQTLYLTLVPQCVISEGIAMVAHEMIFSEEEAERWIAEQMDRLFHREVNAKALLRLRQASDMLEGVWSNAAMLLDEGRPEAEVAQYFVKHMLLPEDRASSYIALLKHPLHGLHVALTYGNGQKLVRRWLQGPDRVAVFHRFLTEQWTPSQLAANSLPA
jgi:hypothetical protein